MTNLRGQFLAPEAVRWAAVADWLEDGSRSEEVFHSLVVAALREFFGSAVTGTDAYFARGDARIVAEIFGGVAPDDPGELQRAYGRPEALEIAMSMPGRVHEVLGGEGAALNLCLSSVWDKAGAHYSFDDVQVALMRAMIQVARVLLEPELERRGCNPLHICGVNVTLSRLDPGAVWRDVKDPDRPQPAAPACVRPWLGHPLSIGPHVAAGLEQAGIDVTAELRGMGRGVPACWLAPAAGGPANDG